MFRLTAEEHAALRSQIATLKTGPGQHRKYAPLAFTEHGALMAASVLSTPRAVEVSVYVIRAFVKLRELLVTNKDLAQRMTRAEQRLSGHDLTIGGLVQAVRQLSNPPAPAKKGSIGFVRPKDE
jgi:ORF6N domain